tara:strand:- start:1171 stop:1602 length:432 start_codon:yes stop_codon:yes gene_type:complete
MANPLENAQINTEGKENIFGMFEYIGHLAVENAIEQNHSVSSVELKTTSIRLPEMKLRAFDAVIRAFDLTRNDAISYAMTQFMADAIAGYSFGRADAMGSSNFEQAASEERAAFIKSLDLDDDVSSYLSSITTQEFVKRLGVE